MMNTEKLVGGKTIVYRRNTSITVSCTGWWIISAVATELDIMIAISKLCNWFRTPRLRSVWQIKITVSAMRDNEVITSLDGCSAKGDGSSPRRCGCSL